MGLITIRQAKEQDVNLIKNLSWQTFFDTFHRHNSKEDMQTYLQENFNEAAVRSEVLNDEHTFFIAYSKREPIGYVKLSESETPAVLSENAALEISRIYSVKEKIGLGVGKALMQQSIDVAKEKKKNILWLGVWEHNQRAIQFYRRWGFEKFSEHVFMLGNDKQNDWLMKKTLV